MYCIWSSSGDKPFNFLNIAWWLLYFIENVYFSTTLVLIIILMIILVRYNIIVTIIVCEAGGFRGWGFGVGLTRHSCKRGKRARRKSEWGRRGKNRCPAFSPAFPPYPLPTLPRLQPCLVRLTPNPRTPTPKTASFAGYRDNSSVLLLYRH